MLNLSLERLFPTYFKDKHLTRSLWPKCSLGTSGTQWRSMGSSYMKEGKKNARHLINPEKNEHEICVFGLVRINQTKCHILPHPKRDAVRRALGVGLTCAGPHCGGRSPHWVLDPEGEPAEHQAESSSDQKYCKPSCPVGCHQLTWTFALDHPVTCKITDYIQRIQKKTLSRGTQWNCARVLFYGA